MGIDKKILSIDYDDDNKNYGGFLEYIENDTERKKNRASTEIEEMGKQFLDEIEIKKEKRKKVQIKLTQYILRHSNNKYTEDELMSYSYEDIKQIYNEIKREKKPIFLKLIHFLFNID